MIYVSMLPGLELGHRIWVPGDRIWLHVTCETRVLVTWTQDGGVLRRAWDRSCGVNVYYCPEAFEDFGTRQADDVTKVPGIPFDIDFGSEGHNKPSNFATFDEAMTHLRRVCGPFQPHVLFLSGHGLQGFVLFDGRLVIGTTANRERVKQVIKGYQRLVGSDVRGLSQPYRLPGTINHKPWLPPVETEIIDWHLNAPGYAFEDLESFLGNAIEPEPEPELWTVDDFPDRLHPDFTDLPHELQGLLMTAASDRSMQTWQILSRMYGLGISVETAAQLLCLNPNLAKKWKGRDQQEVLRVYSKLRAREIDDIPGLLTSNGVVEPFDFEDQESS